ncbi:UDP-glucose dehydrogenase family protein [Nanoarchaeota archaeon]
MNLAVIGTGYVGLVSGACFADKGFDVTCVDIDQDKINQLNQGKVPIYEPGLKEVVENATKRNHLKFTTDLQSAISKAKVIFICVGTPEGEDGRPDMSAVWAVAKNIGSFLKDNQDFKILATKSTVPVGTGDKIESILREQQAQNIAVASNPEFLKEGDAINDFVKPDRVVIGAESEKALQVLTDVYSAFTRKSDRIITMDRRSAELTKYAANAMLALRITYMNQLANLCERVDADITNIRHGIGSDSRIGPSFLFPGPGYGGSCFPKDVKALIHLGQDSNFPLSIVEAVDEFNQKQKLVLAEKVKKHFADLNGKIIAIWGLSFKPQTDDIRESAAIYIIGDLLKAGAKIQAYDPEATDNFRKVYDFNMITYCSSKYDAVKNADALVVVTDWNEFKMPDWTTVKDLMSGNIIFDGRNLYQQSKLESRGLSYIGLGRKIKSKSF